SVPTTVRDELVKDPVCQTYIVKSRAVRRADAGGVRYFCSEQCARLATGSGPGPPRAPDPARVRSHRSQTAAPASGAGPPRRPPDPWRDADAQANVEEMAAGLGARGRAAAPARAARRL